MSTIPSQNPWGSLTAALKEAIERRDAARFYEVLDRLGEARERALYRDLKDLSGRMRAALDEFRLDPRLVNLAGREMPDARLRLDHALRMTEEAAHRTIDLVEGATPLAERTLRAAAQLVTAWAAMQAAVRTNAELDAGAFLALIEETRVQLGNAQRDCESIRKTLGEVMIAQSYQDLSGQIIRSVIALVSELEDALGRFVSLAGSGASAPLPPPSSADLSRGVGPAIPGVSTNTVGEQLDVDALLAANGTTGILP